MKSIDTNILVRAIVRDDAVETPLAIAIFDRPVFLSHGVIMEAEWVLRSRYGWARRDIAAALLRILDVSTVTTSEAGLLRWSLERYAAGAGLPDMLHMVASTGLESFLSFDKKLAAQAGPDAPIRIETLR